MVDVLQEISFVPSTGNVVSRGRKTRTDLIKQIEDLISKEEAKLKRRSELRAQKRADKRKIMTVRSESDGELPSSQGSLDGFASDGEDEILNHKSAENKHVSNEIIIPPHLDMHSDQTPDHSDQKLDDGEYYNTTTDEEPLKSERKNDYNQNLKKSEDGSPRRQSRTYFPNIITNQTKFTSSFTNLQKSQQSRILGVTPISPKKKYQTKTFYCS
eukprot:UN31064